MAKISLMRAPAPNTFIPAEGTQWVPCPLCGGLDYQVLVVSASDYEYDLPGDFKVSRCRGCGLLSQNPRPPFSDILRYYTDKYEPYHDVGSGIMRRVREWALVRPRIKLYQTLIGKQGRVLDVGCSTGSLLTLLKKNTNYLTYGVEPVERAATLAREAGLDVFMGTLEDAPYPKAYFQIIIMNHVLEHVPNPSELVSRAYDLLAPEGYLVGELPSSQCWERAIFGKYWQGYHLPRHLTWFSRHQLARFLKQQGFSKVAVSMQPQPSSWQVSLRNYLTSKGVKNAFAHLFSGHNLGLQLLSMPVALLAYAAGRAPILKFTARK